jgi:hypothetical protein
MANGLGSSAIAKLLVKVCKQTMVYWEFTGDRTAYGDPIFLAPVEVPCRWDFDTNVIKTYHGNLVAVLNGRDVVIEGTVLHPVTYELKVESFVWLGHLITLTQAEQDDPALVKGARELLEVSVIPFFGSDGENPEGRFKMGYI